MMSIFYMILMTAYSSFQLVITKVYEQDNEKALGPFSFMVNYCFGLTFMLISGKTKVR